jgi:DNA-binding transcriptional LysR family regulator
MQLHQMDLKRLRAFYLAARHQSLKGASARLNLTVPAVSLQISALERDLGYELLERVGNKMRTTAAGAALLPEIENIFRAVESALTRIATGKTIRGRVVLAISPSFVSRFSARVASFIRSNPEIEVSIQIKSTEEIVRLVSEGEADFGLGYFRETPAGLARLVIARSGYLLLLPPDAPYEVGRAINFARLAERRFIVFKGDGRHWTNFKRALFKRGVEISEVIDAGNCLTAVGLAEAGLGIAFAHAGCVGSLKSTRLRSVDVTRYAGRDEVAIISARRARLQAHHLALQEALMAGAADSIRRRAR